MNAIKDYYQILGVELGTSPLEIKKAYFSMVRKYPPERFPDEFMRIREAYEALSNEETRKEYDSIATLPPLIRSAFEYARQALAEDKIETAVKLFEEVAERVPDASFVKGLLGEAYLKNGNSGKAIKILEKLVKEHPQNAGFSGHLAHAYLIRGWHKKAIAAFRRAIFLDEDNLSLWYGLSEALARADNYKEARNTLLEALKKGKDKDWDNAGLYFNLVQLDIMAGNLEDMEKHLEELTYLAVNREDIRESVGWTLTQLARFMVRRGLTDLARSMVSRAVRLVPQDQDIQQLKDELDRFEGLKKQFEQLEKDEDIHEDIWSLIGIEILPEAGFRNIRHREINRFFNEIAVLENSHIYLASLRRLEERYPDLYAVKAGFFDGVRNHQKRKKMLKRYMGKLPLYEVMLRQFSARRDEFDDECDDFLLDEDDDKNENYNDYDGDDLFGWAEPQQPYVREQPKIGRNEPCPCGSGKKYKKCCGR